MMSGIMRPCFLSSLLFYESRPPSIYVRGVELLPETFQVGDIRSETGFFGLLCAVLNAPKCPGVADQADVFFDNANGYVTFVFNEKLQEKSNGHQRGLDIYYY